MNGNDFPSVPPPAYELAVHLTNGPATPSDHAQPSSVTYQSEISTAPAYNEPLPYPNSSENVVSRVPPIAMVDINRREPPPGYNQEADDIVIQTTRTTSEGRYSAPTVVQSSQPTQQTNTSSQNQGSNKCIINCCAYTILIAIFVVLIILFPDILDYI